MTYTRTDPTTRRPARGSWTCLECGVYNDPDAQDCWSCDPCATCGDCGEDEENCGCIVDSLRVV